MIYIHTSRNCTTLIYLASGATCCEWTKKRLDRSKNVLWEKVLKHANFGCQAKHSSYVKVALYQRIFSKKLDYRQNYCFTDIFTVQLYFWLSSQHSSYINKGCLQSWLFNLRGYLHFVLSLKFVPYHNKAWLISRE